MPSLSKNEILNFALENGMLDINTIQEQIEMNERQKYLEMHPYRIWQGTNGKWYTYLPQENGGRVQKNRTTRKAIENLIVESIKKDVESPTVKQVFYEWHNKRLERGEIEKSTYSRYERVFEQCFRSIGNKEIKKIDKADVVDFVKDTIRNLNLTRKAYSNMRTIIYGIFIRAEEKGYIDYDINLVLAKIKFSKKEFKRITHEDNEMVFMVREENKIVPYLEQNIDLINLGLLLIFKTGLRIGELVALEKTDVLINRLSITKTETIYTDKNGTHYEIKDFPKTEAGIRDAIVPNNYLWIFKEIKRLCPFGNYLFMENGERIKSYIFRTRLYTLCKQLGIVVKSPHKIRKTYGSILYDADGISEAFIMQQMGHTDISCLKKHYYFNRMETDEQVEMLNNAKVL